MKRIFRTGFAALMLAAFLVLAPAAFAQDMTFGLSDSDYALWTGANAASTAFTSLTLDFTADLAATGLQETDVNANLLGSVAIDTAGAFSLVVTGEVNDGTETTPVNFEARLVDGMVYFNIGDGSGWQGGSADELMSGMGGSLAAGAGLPVDPAALASGDLSGLMANEDLMTAMSGLATLDPTSFMSLTRSDVDGLAQFDLNVSIGDLLQNPAILGMVMSASGAGSEEMSEAEMQQMGMMMGMMFSDAVLSFNQHIDTSTNLVERAVFTFGLPLEMMGLGAGAGINLVFDMDITGYNQPVTVEAPAEFTNLSMDS